MTSTVFIDVGPLQEIRYAGISNVTLHLCRHWLAQEDERSRFFLGPYLVSREAVEAVVAARSGGLFQTLLTGGHAIVGHVANEIRRCRAPVALYPNVKSTSCRFAATFQVMHDISFLLTPEFHHRDTIAYHGLTIANDLAGNALSLCVSHATQSDLVTYLGVPGERTAVCHPGGDPPQEVSEFFARRAPATPERPFIVVPGTIEPRKNIDLILLALKRNPALLARFDWLFLGGTGWLSGFGERLARHGLAEAYRSGTIRWLGFVDEYQKAFLYRHAEMTIYPSFFEGFGIPVVEAMHHGCPVLCSYSSGLPEAGGDAALYFDPTSIVGFETALGTAMAQSTGERDARAGAARRHARHLTWERFARSVDRAIAGTLSEPAVLPQRDETGSDGIVGFAGAATRRAAAPVRFFALDTELAMLRRVERDRLLGLAERVAARFGAAAAASFLHFEILGRAPASGGNPPVVEPDLRRLAGRLSDQADAEQRGSGSPAPRAADQRVQQPAVSRQADLVAVVPGDGRLARLGAD